MSTANTNPAHEEIKTPLTRERIAQDLLSLGLAAGDIVLVHSSMKALGHVDGGPATVIDAFLEVLGEAGTLVFPSFQAGSEHELLRNGCVFECAHHPPAQAYCRKHSGGVPGLSARSAQLIVWPVLENWRLNCSPGKAWDFNDFFAANPELVKHGIGLQPGAFKDFIFNSPSTNNAVVR